MMKMDKIHKRKIAALVEFTRLPRTYADIANLRLPGFSKTRQGIFQRLKKLKVRRRTRGGVSGVNFFDLPDFFQVAIICHFMLKPRTKYISRKKIDSIFYVAACIDTRFAQEWRRREKHLDRVHENIFKIISSIGAKRSEF